MRSTRRIVAAGLLAASLAGCGQNEASPAERVERCVDRLVESIPPTEGTSEDELRQYVELAYCGQFEQSGLVYDDGALEIGAQEWLDRSGTEECATAGSEGSSTTIPCEERQGGRTIECALLRHVRKREAQEYLDDLRARGEIECDDGTPLAELGVP